MPDIKIIHGDCMDYLPKMKDNEFSLAIVDPPYGIGAATSTFMRVGKQTGKSLAVSGLNYKSSQWDSNIPTEEYFSQLRRVSLNQIIFGGNYFNLGATPCYLVWDKDNSENKYADCELAWTSFSSAVRKVRHRWHGFLQEDMAHKEIRIHPTQKPVALYKWLLTNYAKPGQTILDTHLGSGSIAIACHDAGFALTGFELDSDYHAAAVSRFNKHKAQGQFRF